MAQLTVRNVPEDVVRELRVRAARNGRSAEAECRAILAEAVAGESGDFWSRADHLRLKLRKQRTNSESLQREMRDAR